MVDSPKVRFLADIGNSKTKISVVEKSAELGKWSGCYSVEQPSQLTLTAPNPANWLISSVNRNRLRELQEWIAQHRRDDIVHLVSDLTIPLAIDLPAPDKVGTDRLLSAFGATQLAPNRSPIVIVNIGTAVTVDYVDNRTRFCGGLIFPASHACFQSLHSSTDQLPLVSVSVVPPHLIGKNTQQAIASGVWRMQIGAIEYIVGQIKSSEQIQGCPVFVAGGGAAALAPHLNKHWHICPDLVLIGLQAMSKQSIQATDHEAGIRTIG